MTFLSEILSHAAERTNYKTNNLAKSTSLPENSIWTKTSPWSEGTQRNINTIIIGNYTPTRSFKIISELKNIGKQAGFDVKQSSFKEHNNAKWIEDYSIRRHDGKIYILPNLGDVDDIDIPGYKRQCTERNSKLSQEYAKRFSEDKIVRGKTYLEGGNVLNTLLKNGSPAAIIGEYSINYSLKAMKLKDTPKNRDIVIKQMAVDLGLDSKNITIIPQMGFHIDMFHRPLNNGEIVMPDYDEAIKILKNTSIPSMNIEKKKKFIKTLESVKQKYAFYLKDIEDSLTKNGYKIKKIPCFTNPMKSHPSHEPEINYINGISGMAKDGSSYIIINRSFYPELDNQIIKYYKQAGIKNVYFVSTQKDLHEDGGIDCLSQEM